SPQAPAETLHATTQRQGAAGAPGGRTRWSHSVSAFATGPCGNAARNDSTPKGWARGAAGCRAAGRVGTPRKQLDGAGSQAPTPPQQQQRTRRSAAGAGVDLG